MSEIMGGVEKNYLEAEFYDQLNEGHDAFRFLLDAALDGIWYWDLEHPENEWMSPRFWSCLGYDPEEMPHKSSAWQDIIFKEDLQLAQANFEKHVTDPTHPYDQIVRYRHKTGRTIWVQCKGIAIRNAEGKATRMLGIHIDRTDQKIKEELSKANLLLNEAQRLSKTGAWEMDVESGKIFWSDELYAIHEVDKGIDVYKLDGISFYHPDYRPLITKAVEDAIERHIPYDMKCRFITAKGRHIWVRATGYPVLSGGKVTRLFGMFSDITREEEDKWEIEKKQKFSRQLLDNMPDGFSVINKDGKHNYINKAFMKMTGFTEEEILGQKVPFSYWPEEEIPKISSALQQTLDNKPGVYELVFCRKNGDRFPVRLSANFFKDEKGEVLYYYANVTDISELKQATRKLVENEQRYHLALDGASAGLWDWDMVNDKVYFSPLWKKMLGYHEEEIENSFNGWKKLWHPEDRPRIEKAIQDYLEGNLPSYVVEHRLKHKDGSWRWILTRGDLIKDESGKSLRWVGTNVDFTELKKLKELQKEKDDLTKKTLEQNNRLKNFAHIVSHNLRSHSKGLAALMDLYQKENPSAFESQLVQLLLKASDNLEQTIQDLTQVVKAQLDDEVLQPVNLYASIEKNINLVAPMAREQFFSIINNADSNFNVLGINAYIDSVVLNFLTNAIKYRDPAKEESYVEITTQKNDQFVKIDFKDNGLGIDLSKYGEKLFGMYQTFHRGKDSRGIGLYITKNQVETMQGEIEVESEVGVGTTFTTYLRIAD